MVMYCFVLFFYCPLNIVRVLLRVAQRGLDGPDFSAGPQTSPINPLWSPRPALCIVSFGTKLGAKTLLLWFLQMEELNLPL